MKLCITEKDNATLRFVEDFGSITINQCAKLFYDNQVYGLQYAGKKLNKLVKYGKLKVYKVGNGEPNVYYMDKKLSPHDLLALDYYCELIRNKADIKYFKREQSWMNNQYKSDGYCCYTFNDRIYFDIIEVIKTHGFDKNKYIDIYQSNEPQLFNNELYKQLGGEDIYFFPRIILIDDIKHSNEFLKVNDNVQIIQLGLKLNDFCKIFL